MWTIDGTVESMYRVRYIILEGISSVIRRGRLSRASVMIERRTMPTSMSLC